MTFFDLPDSVKVCNIAQIREWLFVDSPGRRATVKNPLGVPAVRQSALKKPGCTRNAQASAYVTAVLAPCLHRKARLSVVMTGA